MLAELGVVFLLFDIGLHFSLAHVREQAGDIFGFGPVQVLAGTAGLGLVARAGRARPGARLSSWARCWRSPPPRWWRG